MNTPYIEVAAGSPTISAIVPALDEARRIGGTIAALLAAGVDEVIVVDGGSQDDTAGAARAAGARVLHAPRGRAAQQNAGAAAARGAVLWFVHADTRVPPTAGAAVLRALAVPGTVGGAFRTRHVHDGPTPAPWPARFLALADLRSRLGRPAYGDQAPFVRRADFEALGGFPAQPLLEDVELSRRLRRRGAMPTLPLQVTVSGRRFVARPVAATVLAQLIPLLAAAGVPPRLLARLWTAVR